MKKNQITITRGDGVAGRWLSKDSESIEFRNNDVYTNGYKIGSYKTTKDYIFIQFYCNGDSDVYSYEINENKMTLENLDCNFKDKDIFYRID